MLHGDISNAPPKIVAFDFVDFLKWPEKGFRLAARDFLRRLNILDRLCLSLAVLDPDAVRVVESLGLYHNFSIYIITHGEFDYDAVIGKLEHVWYSRLVPVSSLAEIRRMMLGYSILWYFSSVVPRKYGASMDGLVPFKDWRKVTIEEMR